jgi:hypothetical protein
VPSLLRVVPASVLAAAIAVSAAACSSSGSGTSGATSLLGAPDQIVQKAVSDLKAATSLHISGSVVSSGTNVTIDLTDVAARGCKGTIALDSGASSSSTGTALTGTADLVEVNSTVYMKLDESIFKNLSRPSSLFKSDVTGKYIEVTAKSELANFAQLCDASTLASGFDKAVTGFVKDGTATINGQATEAFEQRAHAGSGIVYISSPSTPEIVRLQGPASEGQINFTHYNARVTITPPPASEVIDGSRVGL